jgi:uncharacterized membrane protein YfcA
MLIVGIIVLGAAAATMWRSLSTTIGVRPAIALKWMPWIVAPIGFEVGFSSAGAGALGTIVLMRYTDLASADVVGTDLAFGLLLSIFAGGIHASLTGVPWLMVGKLLLGGVPAVLIGTQLIKVVSPRKMRLVLCLWLIYIGGQLALRGVSGMQSSVKAAATQATAPGAATKR